MSQHILCRSGTLRLASVSWTPEGGVIKLLLLGSVTRDESKNLSKCGHPEVAHLFIPLIKKQLFFCSLNEHLSSSHHGHLIVSGSWTIARFNLSNWMPFYHTIQYHQDVF